jgi:plasmid maintenance system antidote protein VapI
MKPSASELRAEIARRQLQRYKLAAQVGVHPGRLGQMLNGKLPLPEELATRLAQVLHEADHAA